MAKTCDRKSTKLILTVSLGSLIIGLVCTFAPVFAQIAILGCYVSIVAGLIFNLIEKESQREKQIDAIFTHLEYSRALAQQSMTFEKYEQIVSGICRALKIEDELFRKLALDQLKTMGEQSETLGNGEVEFHETESWRVAYEKILRCDDVMLYLSIARVESAGYWQDEPGKNSIQLNYQLQDDKELSIERIFIINDALWPKDERLPNTGIADWIYDQHNHGIWVELVRESELVDEPDLLVDTGIYGNRATGVQILDAKSRTAQFTLSFNARDIEAAHKRWEKLRLFSTPLREILDQA